MVITVVIKWSNTLFESNLLGGSRKDPHLSFREVLLISGGENGRLYF